jgi:polar amino acid transport system substrate-binding protein
MNPRRYAWLLIGCLMLSAACSAARDDRLDSSVELLDIPAATTPSTPPASNPSCAADFRASLRPEGPLPPPNNISPDSFMGAIKKRRYLIVGVDKNTNRLGYYNPKTGQFEGFDIDIAREIAKAIFGADLRDKIHFRALLTNERISAVKETTVDIVADAVTITCARTELAAFSNIYFMGHQRILVRSDSQARSPSDLRGKKVCATTGSTALETKLPDVVPYPVRARTDCLVALEQGDVDGILTDDSILYGFREQDPDTRMLEGNITDEPYGLAIAKSHPEFVRFVNAVLEQMRSDGRWTEIWKYWFGSVQIGGQQAKPPDQPQANYKD